MLDSESHKVTIELLRNAAKKKVTQLLVVTVKHCIYEYMILEAAIELNSKLGQYSEEL